MTDDAFAAGSPPAPERGNGLHADAWVSLCDVDPRLAAPLLEALADADIPAYVAPSTGSVGPHLEMRRTDRLNERVWVDAGRRRQAEALVATTLPELRASLEDERWAAIVASLTADETSAAPADEPAEPAEPDHPTAVAYVADDDDHFEPPDPPLAPLDHPLTRYGWIALIGGCLLLLVPALLGTTLGGGWLFLAVAAIIGGFVTLVLRMKDSPPTDSGPDDGAVV